MTAPVILFDNRFLNAAPAASSTASGFDVLNIRDGRTYTFWKAAYAGVNTLTVLAPGAADTIAIVGHNLYSCAAQIYVESSINGISWTQRHYIAAVSHNRALLSTFSLCSDNYWRVRIVTASIAPYLAVIALGLRLAFPQPPASPFIPYSETTEEENVISKAGQPLGTVVRYHGIEINPEFTNISRAWVDGFYVPFHNSYARLRKYFFWAWDIGTYPDQVFYVKDIAKFETPVSVLAYYNKIKMQLKGVLET